MNIPMISREPFSPVNLSCGQLSHYKKVRTEMLNEEFQQVIGGVGHAVKASAVVKAWNEMPYTPIALFHPKKTVALIPTDSKGVFTVKAPDNLFL